MSTKETISPALSGAPARYAEALFELAEEHGALESVEADLGALAEASESAPEFKAFLESPVYGAEEKARAMAAFADKAGFSDLTRNFLGVVADNMRLGDLSGVIAAFANRLAAHRGEISAQAISAAPLNEEQVRRLRGEIEGVIGKAVNLTVETDRELLGGLVVKLGSKMFDTSLRTKLNKLKSVMKEA